MGAPASRSIPVAVPTVTLAEIYAAQGHRARAVETLEGVLAREPEHAAARSLVAQLRDGGRPIPAPRMPPEPEEEPTPVAGEASETPVSLDADPVEAPPAVDAPAEPSAMLDDQPLPPRYDVDECVASVVDPRTVYVYWEVRASTRAALQAISPGGRLALRLAVVEPAWGGPRASLRDHDAVSEVGDFFAGDLPAGCIVRAAIGWLDGARFESIAHAPALEPPIGAPSPFATDVLVRWSPAGRAARLDPSDPDAAPLADVLGLVGRHEAQWRVVAIGRAAFVGSSDRWARPTSYPPKAAPHPPT